MFGQLPPVEEVRAPLLATETTHDLMNVSMAFWQVRTEVPPTQAHLQDARTLPNEVSHS